LPPVKWCLLGLEVFEKMRLFALLVWRG